MGTILASSVIRKAQKILQDETNVRWPEDELVSWLNSAQRQIVLIRPDARSETRTVQLGAGSKQTIPTDATRLLKVIRNQGTGGDTPGKVITFCQAEILDSQRPDWHFANPNAEVKHYITDERDPRTWYSFPPQPTGGGAGQVLMMISLTPEPCTVKDVPKEDGSGVATVTSTIAIDDVYENPLIDFIVYRCESKDSDFANPARAAAHYASFAQALGLKMVSDKVFSAVSNSPPRSNPNVTHQGGAFGQ